MAKAPIIRIIDILNDMDITQEDREAIFLKLLGMDRESGEFIYTDGKLDGFRIHGSEEKLELTIGIDSDSVKVEHCSGIDCAYCVNVYCPREVQQSKNG